MGIYISDDGLRGAEHLIFSSLRQKPSITRMVRGTQLCTEMSAMLTKFGFKNIKKNGRETELNETLYILLACRHKHGSCNTFSMD